MTRYTELYRAAFHVVSFLFFMTTFVVGEETAANGDNEIKDFVAENCERCHNSKRNKGNLDLTTLTLDFSQDDQLSRWVRIHDRVERGEMPPGKKDRIEAEERSLFVSQLSKPLHNAISNRQEKYGRSRLRRLGRAEFSNSLIDLLALPHLELVDRLPPDGIAYGFDKSSNALDFSHVQVMRYLEVIDFALSQAIVPRLKGKQSQLIRSELKSIEGVNKTLQTLRVQLKHGTGIPLIGTQKDPTLDVWTGNFAKREPGYVRDPKPYFNGVATFMNSRDNHNITLKPFRVKQSGYYKIRVKGFSLLNDHGKVLPSDRVETVSFYAKSGRLLGRCDLQPGQPNTSEVQVWLEEGEPIEYLASSAPNKHFKLPNKLKPFKYHHFKSHGIGLQAFELEGPLNAHWPPESHKRLFGELKLSPSNELIEGRNYQIEPREAKKSAQALIKSFVSRALRRPVRETDLEIPFKIADEKLKQGKPFIEAVLSSYRAVLSSPSFLLLEDKPGKLGSWALASRLSFFLTNSPPDEELRRSAASGKLLEDKELRAQTDRLLNSAKSSRFVSHFLDYWMDLRKLRLTEPDVNLYPEYNALLVDSMYEETLAYFTELIREDLGAEYLIDSDFLMINQRLAELYGISGVQGYKIRKVKIPNDSVRGGMLTQASILKLTANGTTTSPVVRGTFVLDRFLGDPAPPPPPSVPAVEPDISGATTIREQLDKHREDPSCSSCHEKIDPPGFALESFDVMGTYRKNYRALIGRREKGVDLAFNGKPVRYKLGQSVDSAGHLPTGEKFSDIKEFRELLKGQVPQIARHLLDQLIVYSTGAPVSFVDRPQVKSMLARLQPKKFGVRSMIHEIVQSDLFRKK